MHAPPPIVLVVDDEENVLRSLRRLLRGEPFRTVVTTDPYEALSALRDGPVAVLVTDQRMPELDGDHLIARVRALDGRIVCIRLTGYPDAGAQAGLPREAVFRTIDKPWDDQELLDAVREAVALYEGRAPGVEAASTDSTKTQGTHAKEDTP